MSQRGTKAVRWTQEEDAILEAVYPHHGTRGACEVIPGRKESAICQRVKHIGLYRLVKAERSTQSPKELADAARSLVPAQSAGIAMPRSAPNDGPKSRRTGIGPRGMMYEHGKTAGTTPGLEKVPESVTNLPWVSYPRDPDSANAVAAVCEYMSESDVVKKVGPEAQRFFESQAKYLRAIAQRMQVKAAA